MRSEPSMFRAFFGAVLLLPVGPVWAGQASPVWYRQFGTLPYQFDGIEALSVDGGGNAIVAGRTEGSLFTTTINDGGSDVFVAKFDPAGNMLWGDQLGAGFASLSGFGVDSAGNTYVAGSGTTLQEAGFAEADGSFMVKYDPMGSVQWRRVFTEDLIDDLAVTAWGDLFVSGGLPRQTVGEYGDFLARFDSDGNEIWREVLADDGLYDVRGISLTGNGDIALVTPEFNANNPVGPLPAYLATFSDAGLHLGSTAIDSPGILESADSGGVYVVNGSEVTAYDASRNEMWSRTLSTGVGRALATDEAGALYIAASIANSFPIPEDVLLYKYSAEGRFLWQRTLGGNYRDFPLAVGAGAGYVYVGGWTEGSFGGQDPNPFPGQQADALLIRAIPEPALGLMVLAGVPLLSRRNRVASQRS